MFNLILIDFSWLYNRYFFIAKNRPGASSQKEEELFKDLERMLLQFLQVVERNYPVAKIILALDTPTSALKNTTLFKGYKQNRNKDVKKEVYSRFHEVVIHLDRKLGKKFTFVRSFGYEADQVIAAVCEKFHEEKCILIYSGDKDLLQLTAYSNVYSSEKFEKGKFLLRTDKEVFAKFKNSKGEDFTRISTNKKDILKYRTLKGDSSDNLSPVFPRIKDTEIVSIITKYWTNEDDTLSENQIDDMILDIREANSTLADKLESAKDVWLRNYQIMNLFGLKDLKIKRINGNGNKT